MRRAGAVATLAALAFLSFGASLADAGKPAGPRAAQGPRATYLDWISVAELSDGELTADGRPVRAGFFAVPGARLELSSGGRAVLTLGKAGALEGVVELRGPAAFQVMGGRQPGFDLVRGRLLAVLPSLKSPFHVRARGLVAAVRGTDFYLDLAGRNDLYLCVCRGAVEMSDGRPRGYRRTVKGEHHSGVGYRIAERSTLESEHSMEGHGDEDIDALRALLSQ